MQKLKIVPVIVTDKEALRQALDKEVTAIFIQDELFYKMKDKMKKSKAGKITSISSGVGALLGFATGGVGGILITVAGLIGTLVGSNMDKVKQYDIEVDTIKERIVLLKAAGKNKYKKSKHEIVYE